MAALYTCLRQLHPPTGIRHAVWGSLTKPGCPLDLVVARRSLIELYSPATVEGDEMIVLELIGGFPVSGVITDVSIIRLEEAATPRPDLLAVTLSTAKVVILAFDAALSRLTTLSLHNLEEDSIGPGAGALGASYGLGGAMVNRQRTLTAVDPHGRCLGVMVGGCQLAVLPLMRHVPMGTYVCPEGRQHILGTVPSAEDEFAAGAESPEKWTEIVGGAKAAWARWVAQKPFHVDMEEAGISGVVRDVCFLQGLNEPALAILYEDEPTWAGRLAALRSTCHVALLSLCVPQGRAPSIWRVANLPHDSKRLVPVPLPIGGLLVVSTNAILYLNENEVTACVGVNGFASVTVHPSLPLQPNEGDFGWASFADVGGPEVYDLTANEDGDALELDESAFSFLAPDAALVSLASGDICMLRVHISPAKGVVEYLTLRRIGTSPSAAVLASVPFGGVSTGLCFLGSMLGDSLLLRWELLRGSRSVQADELYSLHRSMKKEEEVDKWEAAGSAEGAAGEEENFLYGSSSPLVQETGVGLEKKTKAAVEALGIRMRVLDSLVNIGPIVDMDVGPVATGTAVHSGESTSKETVILCSTGFGSTGGLTAVAAGHRTWPVCHASMAGVEGIWSLGKGAEAHILLTGEGWTRLLRLQAGQDAVRLVESIEEATPFASEVRTVCAGELEGGREVQVFEHGVRVVLEGAAVQDIVATDSPDIGGAGLPEGSLTLQADVCGPFVLLLQDTGDLGLLLVEHEEDTSSGDLMAVPPPIHQGDVVAASLCSLGAQVFASTPLPCWVPYNQDGPKYVARQDQESNPCEEEEALLYGDLAAVLSGMASTDSSGRGLPPDATTPERSSGVDLWSSASSVAPPSAGLSSIYCCLSRRGGCVEVHHLQRLINNVSWTLVFKSYSAAAEGAMAVWNDLLPRAPLARVLAERADDGDAAEDDLIPPDPVTDVILHRLGGLGAPAQLQRLALALRLASGDLIVYEARFAGDAVACFIRVAHDFVARPLQAPADSQEFTLPRRSRSLGPLSDLGGSSALACWGPNTRTALTMSERGALCVAPMAAPHAHGVTGMAAIPSSPDMMPVGGLALVSPAGVMFLSAAPMVSQFVKPGVAGCGGAGGGGQGHFVSQRHVLGGTVRRSVHVRACPTQKAGVLTKLLATPTYAAIVAQAYDMRSPDADSLGPVLEEDEEEDGKGKCGEDVDIAMADDQNGAQHEEENGNDDDDGYGKSDSSRVRYKNFAVPDPKFGGPPALMDFRWELQLLTVRAVPSGGVQPTPGISVVEIHKLSRYEHALTVDVVEIGEEGEQRPFVALGTGYVTDQGEDQPPRGRLLLYEVDYAHVAKEDGGHEYQVKLREVVRKVMQGSVSVVTKLGRNLIVAVGKSITVFAWDAKAVGIKPIGIYEASQYVVSIQVIKDYILIGDAVNSAQFLVWREEDRSLTQLAKDYEPANVMSVGYVADPPSLGIAVADTSGGLRLLQYAPRSMDSRGGHLLLPMARAHTGTSVSAMVPLRGRDRGPNARYGLAMGTLDGSLAYLGPVEERVFRRLAALQSMMVNALEHTAGANPRAGGGAGGGDRARRHILDGQLLWRFISLDRQFQHQLTRAVGTTVERVLSNLQELDLNAAWGLA